MRKVTVSIPEIYTSSVQLEVEDGISDEDIKERAKVLFDAGDYSEDSLDSVMSLGMEMWDITEEVICTSTDPTNHQGDTCPIHEKQEFHH